MTERPILLAAALSDLDSQPDPARWTAAAQAAEAAGLDLVTIEPGPQDPLLVAARLAAQTERIGLLPVVPTTTTEPFHVSTALATIDFVSRGRAGWLAQVEDPATADGLVTWPVPDDVVADADEHVAIVRALWDSWEQGAEIRDAQTARFIDATRVHHIDHEGARLSVRGPSITPRPPQGQPIVGVRASVDGIAELAAERADVLFTADPATPVIDGVLRFLELEADGTVPADLLRRIETEHARGFDGILLRAADLPAALTALRPLLEARPPHPPGDTLRERLGLAAAVNRFEVAA